MYADMSVYNKPLTAPNPALPSIFEQRWAPNFKGNHHFSKHDNYNTIQNFGEYYDTGYGKKYFQDVQRQSNQVFVSKEPFTKYTEDKSKRAVQSCPIEAYGYRRRYPKRHTPRLLNANDHANEIYTYNKGPSINTYIKKKEKIDIPHNSLNFESEMFLMNKMKKDLFATEGFKHSFIRPWKYSYTKNDYQTCTEQFRRVRSSNIDLSKY